MKKKIVFKSMLTLMTVSILPFSNFGVFAQPSQSTSASKTAVSELSKALKLTSVSADDSTPTNAANSNGIVPTDAQTFSGVDIGQQPSRPALPTSMSGTTAKNPQSFGYQASINGLPNVAAGQIAVIQNGNTVFNASSVTDGNVQAALTWINSNGSSSDDDVLFIGGNVTLSATTMAAGGNAGSFSGLAGHAKSLTVVSAPTDSLTSSPNVAASGASTVTSATANYLGVPTIFRNITIAGNNNIYANGNAVAILPGANFSGSMTVFGGTDGKTDTSGDTNIFVSSTGTGAMSFYGGNNAGGNVAGTTHLTITNGTSFGTISGGNASGGTIVKGTNVQVTGFTGSINSGMYGGGVGTSAAPVTVNGDIYNYYNSSNSASTYNSIFYGGANYGAINGKIYNTFIGLGKYNGEEMFNGGVNQGTVGQSGNTSDEVFNNYDSSQFTSGYGNFAGISGANNAASSGNKVVAYGNVTNYVKSAYVNGGYLGGVAGAYGAGYLNNTTMPASSDSNNNDNGASAAQTAASKAQASLYGNAYTYIRGGLVSYGFDYNIVLGGGYGYIQGQTVMETGDASTAPGGNTTGENGVADGSRSSSNRTGVGGSGYVAVYDAAGAAAAQTIATNGKAYSTTTSSMYGGGADIVGGGGNDAGNGSNYWQVGNSYLIQNNSTARWTYGGNWSGNHIGNAYNFNNGSIVDTLEGGDYGQGYIYGNSAAQSNNGQVDWFFSGGAWNTKYIAGSMTTVVNNGVINANTGGNYALSGNNVTKGNSSVYIYGGDFSGNPRTDAPKTVCGGNFNSGSSYIYGNSLLTLDLTGPNGPSFKFPKANTYLSAGNGYNKTGGTLGTDSSNSISLIIKANKTTASTLASATIYGDGSNSSNINVGTINMTIDADGAQVGNVYASNRSILSTSGYSRNVVTKIGEGTTIVGSVYNSSSSDNLTSANANANANNSTLQFGDGTGSTADPIVIQGKVVNFKSAVVNPNVNLTVSGGVLNGASATANNHAATYSSHGNLTLSDNSTLAVSTSSSVISAGKLTVGRSVQLSSPYVNTAGLMNFSDLAFNAGGGLTWIPTGTATAPTSTYSGAYWGQQKGFPVLTFNGGTANTGSGAYNITPGNFQGVDSANNYAFLGDYTQTQVTTPTSSTWIGYVVPGQIRVFNTADANAGTLGNWTHNLTGVTTGTPTAGTAMSAWSDTPAGTASNSIRIMYTMQYANSVNPAFNFASATGSYVQSRSASRYDGGVLNNYSSYSPNFTVNPDGSTTGGAVPNFSTNDYFTGNQQNGSNDQSTFGSYIIESAVTNNQSVLNVARNSIVNNTKATSLTVAQLEGILGVSGTGIVSDLKLSSPTLSTINSGIANANGGTYNSLPVKFTMDSATANANLVIVPDHATISADGQNALDVYDATLTGDEAHAITTDVNSITPNESAKPPVYANGVNYYTGLGNAGNVPLAITADGTVSTPTLSNKAALIAALQAIADSGTLTANYTFNGLTMNAVLTINVGYLEFTSAPANIDWGKLSISPKELTAYPTYSGDASGATGTGQIIVTDTRTGSQATPWTLVVAASAPFAQNDGKGNNSLASYLMLNNGASKVNLTSANTLVHSETSKTPGVYNLNQNWGSASGQGIYLDVPVNGQHIGSYQGQLTWTLSSVPGNN